MENGTGDIAIAGSDRHVQAVDDKFSAHVIGRGPADRPLGVAVSS